MATKPTSSAFTWATNANYSTGYDVGHPTKANPPGWPAVVNGLFPNLGAVIAHLNTVLNKLGNWSGWLDAGSPAGAADTHLVETDANGETIVTGIYATDAGQTVEVRGETGITYRQDDLPDADSQIDGVAADAWMCTTPTAQRKVELLEGGAETIPLRDGMRTTIYRPNTGNFAIVIHRIGQPAALVTLPALTHCAASFEVRSSRWRLLMAGAGSTPGADS